MYKLLFGLVTALSFHNLQALPDYTQSCDPIVQEDSHHHHHHHHNNNNRRGPTGPAGPTGPTGATGATGATGDVNFLPFAFGTGVESAPTIIPAGQNIPFNGIPLSNTAAITQVGSVFTIQEPGYYSVVANVNTNITTLAGTGFELFVNGAPYGSIIPVVTPGLPLSALQILNLPGASPITPVTVELRAVGATGLVLPAGDTASIFIQKISTI